MHLRDLVNAGVLGEVLSTTITGWGNGWGPSIEIEKVHSYLLDKRNGASMLTIPIGHTLAAVTEALGPFHSLSAVLGNRRTYATARDTGATVPMTSHDQVLLSGVLANGGPISLHYRGGTPRYAPGMVWEVNRNGRRRSNLRRDWARSDPPSCAADCDERIATVSSNRHARSLPRGWSNRDHTAMSCACMPAWPRTSAKGLEPHPHFRMPRNSIGFSMPLSAQRTQVSASSCPSLAP